MKFKSINSSLAVLITGIVFVSVVGLVLVVNHMTNSAVMTIQEQNMEVLNNKTVHEVEDFINQIRSDLRESAVSPEVRRAFSNPAVAAKVERTLKSKISHNKRLANIAAFNRNGKVVYGIKSNGQSAKGVDLSSREYVRKVLNGSDFAISDVLKSVLDDQLIVVMAVPVRNAKGKLLGGFLYSVDWYKYSMEMIGDITIGNDGYAYIIDAKGKIIAHKVNREILLKDYSDLPFVQESLSTPKGKTSYVWDGREKVQMYQVVPETGWVVCMSAYVSDLTQAAVGERNVLIGLGLVMIIILVGTIVYTIRHQVTGPMANIRDFSSEIADGNFKAELKGKYVCELKDLADNIEHMVGEIKNKLGFSEGVLSGLILPCSLVGPNDNMLWANSQLCELIESRVAPADVVGMNPGEFFYNDRSRKTLSQKAIAEERQIQQDVEYTTFSGRRKDIMVSTTPFYDMDGIMLGSVSIWIDMTEIREQQRKIEENNIMISEAAVSATEVSNQVTSFSEALAAQVEQSSRGAEEQSMMASEAATAMDEMNSTVFEVARNASTAADLADDSQKKAGEGEEMVARAVDTISQVRAQSEQMKQDMADLGKQADGIGNIMGVISDIADQTNLLALNAAIEAARAGDAGRGFAVVADEVRKLAESTMTATTEVGEYITSIQNSARANIDNTEKSTAAIGEVTDLINQSGDVLKEIVASISETSDQVRSIATASEQQSAASEEISRSTGQINAIASETSQAMNESAEAVGRMSELAQELNRIIERMKG